MCHILQGVKEVCRQPVYELVRREEKQYHFLVENEDDLGRLCSWMRANDYWLISLVAADERLLESHSFVLYYIFSTPAGETVTLERPVNNQQHPRQYASQRKFFPALASLEQEIEELFGLSTYNQELDSFNGALLHPPYPLELYPLRRTRRVDDLFSWLRVKRKADIPPPLAEGMYELPIGPIHAEVIEAGFFPFQVAGEVIESVKPRLGYKFRGIEKRFESHYNLLDGWRLAEKVSGDSSFAHSLAYCQAVEALAQVKPPPLAEVWRGLGLELERLYNHIGDFAALVHDMAFETPAAQFAIQREEARQLNQRLTGSRMLRGVNRPGGVQSPPEPDWQAEAQVVESLAERFLQLGEYILNWPACRDRTEGLGRLTSKTAEDVGATGLVRRASGCPKHDARLRHPFGVYCRPDVQQVLADTVLVENEPSNRLAPIYDYHLTGDVFGRMALRLAEVETSARLILRWIAELQQASPGETTCKPIETQLHLTSNYDYGIGIVEGWRGEVFYWLVKGPENTIFRCMLRDPSIFNWPALGVAVSLQAGSRPGELHENILADFPLINKSFNLSYAANDR